MDFTTLIDAVTLRGLLGRPPPGSVIVDCRFDLAAPEAGRIAYAQSHIPGALYVDLNHDLAAPVTAAGGRHPLPAPTAFRGLLAALGIGHDTQVVAYDATNGSFAARLWWLLRWVGHGRVAVLDGGFKAWLAGGGALESGDATPGTAVSGVSLEVDSKPRSRPDSAPGAGPRRPDIVSPGASTLSVGFPAGLVADAAEVLCAIRDPARLVVDARAAERFAGTVEPIDPVAGHVPGAVNHPFTGNLAADGRFLPAGELRRRWLERLAGTAPGSAILMCGSGVTACHNALAMEIAGLEGAKLYAGSWSEWIRDPLRPVTPPRPPP